MKQVVRLKDILNQLGFCLPDWPREFDALTDESLTQYGHNCLEVFNAWHSNLHEETPQMQKLVLNLIQNLAKSQKLQPWDCFVGEMYIATVAAELDYAMHSRMSNPAVESLVKTILLPSPQLFAAALILAQYKFPADAIIAAADFVDSSDLPAIQSLECLLEILGFLDFSSQVQEARESIEAWYRMHKACIELAELTIRVVNYLAGEGKQISANADLINEDIPVRLCRIASLCSAEDAEDDVNHATVSPLAFKADMQESDCSFYPMATSAPAVDGFTSEVYRQIHRYVQQVVQEKKIVRIDHVVVVSARLQRYFDPALQQSLATTVLDQWRMAQLKLPTKNLSISLLGELDPAKVTANTLYIICSHVMPGETEFACAIANEQSIAIGWLWDNHHSYLENYRLAALLDVAIPSHHKACEAICAAQIKTTRPLPLATCQWSIPTFTSYTSIHNKDKIKYLLIGRYSNWLASPSRSEVVSLLNEAFGDNPLFDLSVSSPEGMEFLQMSPLQRARDWSASISSLVLAVRNDLSMRFFDSMLCGCVPIVDSEISMRALDDLKPGILDGKHYLTCNSRDPIQLLEAVKRSSLITELHYNSEFKRLLLRHHMLESRLSLIIHAALSACEWL